MCRILIVLDDKLTILSLSLSLSPNDQFSKPPSNVT